MGKVYLELKQPFNGRSEKEYDNIIDVRYRDGYVFLWQGEIAGQIRDYIFPKEVVVGVIFVRGEGE